MSQSNPFHIAGGTPEPRMSGAPVHESDRDAPAIERVESMVAPSSVLLFMKGSPAQPQCGFSANAVAILESFDVPYDTFDVLSDDEIREAAKTFAGWPTFPQLWVKGELVGGNDIMMDMMQTGELEPLIKGAVG
ncbi:MAG: Grx4 family monothiol glutaredoxin [Thermoanaerobaculales bacterium]|nr:Grx4 family monothiol glutaredoxin [Thermoanaerobaculales bacterium]